MEFYLKFTSLQMMQSHAQKAVTDEEKVEVLYVSAVA